MDVAFIMLIRFGLFRKVKKKWVLSDFLYGSVLVIDEAYLSFYGRQKSGVEKHLFSGLFLLALSIDCNAEARPLVQS